MTRTKFITVLAAVGSCVLVGSALPALGAESGTVSAHVSVAAPCLTVSTKSGNGTLDFGTLSFATPLGVTSSNSTVLQNDPTWSNCGTGTESVYAKGSDATAAQSQAVWSLFDPNPNGPSGTTLLPCDVGPNKYSVSVFVSASANAWLLNTNRLVGSLAPSAGAASSTQLRMPCSGSGGAGETMNFTITFTASL